MKDLIYLDNNSTTQLDPRVLEKTVPFLTSEYGNASSNHHFGLSVNKHVREAREQLASLIDCEEKNVILTSGATEAINLGLKGIMEHTSKKRKNHILTACTEHHSVLDTCNYLEKIGYDVTYLPVEKSGILNLELLRNEVRESTLLICVMIANNETGVIQPIKEIAEIAHKNGSLFMSDGTQAVGKISVSMKHLGIDLLAFSGHKFCGPKGVGALCISNTNFDRINLNPMIHGGGHERGLRSGTLNVPAIVGFGAAADLARQEMGSDHKKIEPLRNHLEAALLAFDHAYLNGDDRHRMYNVSNICFPGIAAEHIISSLKSIAISNGSACSSELIEPSHVLKGLGRSDDDAFSSIRFSLGRFNTEGEIEIALQKLQVQLRKAKMAIDA